MGMRKKILQSAESKVSTAKEIIQKYEIKKWIAFSKYINQAESLYEELQLSEIPSVLYTSKMDDKTRKENLVKVEDPSIRAICSAEALNTGYNLPELDGAIAMSFSSDAISLTQQLGRCVRFKQNKQAIYINLFIPSTQEEVWMKSRLKGMQYLVLSGTKELKNYIN